MEIAIVLVNHWSLADLDTILKIKKKVNFQSYLLIDIFRFCDNALRWMPQDLINDKLTLVQVMAWCHQATSHYLSQCRSRSISPYGVTRGQWVNQIRLVLASQSFLSLSLQTSHFTFKIFSIWISYIFQNILWLYWKKLSRKFSLELL